VTSPQPISLKPRAWGRRRGRREDRPCHARRSRRRRARSPPRGREGPRRRDPGDVAPEGRRRPRRQAPVETQARAHVQDRGDPAKGQKRPGSEGGAGREATGEGDGRHRAPERHRARGFREGLPAPASRVGPERHQRRGSREDDRRPEGRPGEGHGHQGEGQGEGSVGDHDTLGEARPRVPDSLAPVHQRETQGVTDEEGGHRPRGEADPGDRRREHQSEDEGLHEEAPPAVLDGHRDRLPRDRGRGRLWRHGQKEVNVRRRPMGSD
jgi:hypothetical protein